MEVVHPRCAGLDVHKDSVVACVRNAEGARVECETRTFGTTTAELTRLGEWLKETRCTHAAMEATGVYWVPVWHILEGHLEQGDEETGEVLQLMLVNPQHIKAIPRKKTDKEDARWLADLLAHELVRGSFVPPAWVQDLRALMRTRKQFVHERTRHVQRIQKTLEQANVKLASVISDITGTAGTALLRAIIGGEKDPEKLVEVITTRLSAKRETLVEALRGAVTARHRFVLDVELGYVEKIDATLVRIDKEAAAILEPFRAQLERLTAIPGVGDLAAGMILAEIGTDMTRFATPAHLVSWAGLAPRNDESAGKRQSTRTRKGNVWLKALLVQVAWAAVRTKDSYLRAQFMRIKTRRGPLKAILAVAASILSIVHVMLARGVEYRDLGADYFDKRDREKLVARLTRKLDNLGYNVLPKAA
jgi:transposase